LLLVSLNKFKKEIKLLRINVGIYQQSFKNNLSRITEILSTKYISFINLTGLKVLAITKLTLQNKSKKNKNIIFISGQEIMHNLWNKFLIKDVIGCRLVNNF